MPSITVITQGMEAAAHLLLLITYTPGWTNSRYHKAPQALPSNDKQFILEYTNVYSLNTFEKREPEAKYLLFWIKVKPAQQGVNGGRYSHLKWAEASAPVLLLTIQCTGKPSNKMSTELRMQNPVLYKSLTSIKSYLSQANRSFGHHRGPTFLQVVWLISDQTLKVLS